MYYTGRQRCPWSSYKDDNKNEYNNETHDDWWTTQYNLFSTVVGIHGILAVSTDLFIGGLI